ncbi:hypothetical protein HK096_009387, partial [Nowakowskiella sp. JEL0078]
YANTYGFIILFPEVTRSGKCWDVSTSKSLTRNGGSDSTIIMTMVANMKTRHNIDSYRIFVAGLSSGVMMTNVLLAEYPDVFKAGSVFMGVPYTCLATESGGNPSGTQAAGWNSACSSGTVIKTAQQWGDIARAGDPGFSGTRPLVQLWHGALDTTLNYANFAE